MTKTMLSIEEDKDMWKKLFEDCNKKQGEEIESLRREYKQRSERLSLTTAVEKVIPARDIPLGTFCTVPMSTRMLTATGRRHNEGSISWNNILRSLASRTAGRMILMDIEQELRALDQARLTTDGIHFDSIEGQAWLNRVFHERLDEMEVELFDTGVLKKEETSIKTENFNLGAS